MLAGDKQSNLFFAATSEIKKTFYNTLAYRPKLSVKNKGSYIAALTKLKMLAGDKQSNLFFAATLMIKNVL